MANAAKITEADADRIASQFGLAPEAVRATIGLPVRTAANQLAIGEEELKYGLGDKVRAEQARLAEEENTRAAKRAKDNDHTKFGESELEKDLSRNPNPSSETVKAEAEKKAARKTTAKKAAAKKAPAKKAPAKKAPAKKTAKKAAKKASPRKTTAKRSAKKR